MEAAEPASDSDEVQGMYMLDHETDNDYETNHETCPSNPKTCPSKTCPSDTDETIPRVLKSTRRNDNVIDHREKGEC